MLRKTLIATMVAGALGAGTVAAVQPQQQPGSSANTGVISATPIHSEAMVNLERSAQRLREAIQSLGQKPPGHAREQAMSDARRALYDTQWAMAQLPADYRVAGIAVSNIPLTHANPDRNRSYGDSVKDLQLAADRLRASIQSMAQAPAGKDRDAAIRLTHEALLETQRAMVWVPGYPSTASSESHDAPWDRVGAQGALSDRSGGGAVGSGMTRSRGKADAEAALPAVAGGVGLNARAMLSNDALPDHNVKMVFSLDTGNYLADVGVEVKDASGRTVIEGVSGGPWLYAKLPPGTYTATATYNGKTVSKRFSAGRSGQRVTYFRWPASVEQARTSGIAPILGTGPQEAN